MSDSYARRVINEVEEVDLTGYEPPVDCVIRRKVLDHIVSGAGYVFVPNTEKYAYLSLLGYLGMNYETLKGMFPDDQGQFIYMALHRSDKAWKNLHSDFMGVDQEDYNDLMQIKQKKS